MINLSHISAAVLQLCTERTGVSGERAVWGQNHPPEVPDEEVSAHEEPRPRCRVSALPAGGDKPAPLLCCNPGKHTEA